ncbi:MAG: rpfC [Acidobacteriales bacterium]|nr:rpfC [Terriglobales bacterium]
MSMAGTAASIAKTANIQPVKREEWPSFRGVAVPERQDAREVGDDFIRAVHHKLSQPITSLRCSLELLQLSSKNDPSTQKQVLRALEQADRVMELVVSFRALLEADRVEREVVPASLTSMLNEVVDDMRPIGRDRKVELVLPWNLDQVLVRGSRAQLRQVLWNLIQNCVELSVAGDEVRIHLFVNDLSVELTVNDCCRVDDTASARIFDPFSYCENTSGEKISNLPIAVVQRIVVALGGAVLASRSDDGRMFKVSLPVFPQPRAGNAG